MLLFIVALFVVLTVFWAFGGFATTPLRFMVAGSILVAIVVVVWTLSNR
jgi:hypothetical protein